MSSHKALTIVNLVGSAKIEMKVLSYVVNCRKSRVGFLNVFDGEINGEGCGVSCKKNERLIGFRVQ